MYCIIVSVMHTLTFHFYITLRMKWSFCPLLVLNFFNSETLPPLGLIHRPPHYNLKFIFFFLQHLSFMEMVEFL